MPGVRQTIYVETSVFNNYYETDSNERLTRLNSYLTRDLFARFDKFDKFTFVPHVSLLVIKEILRAPDKKAIGMMELIIKYNMVILRDNETSINLAKTYIKANIFTEKSYYDARHVAMTTANNIDSIVSLNLKDIAKPTKRDAIINFNKKFGFPTIRIVTPGTVMLDEEL
jgi:hypothetical protein